MPKNASAVGIMGGKKTKQSLLKKLEQAAGRSLTQQEIIEQRVSFIAGSLHGKNKKISHKQISKILDRIDGTKVAQS